MTRKQLVSGLRALHEDDIIDNIRLVKRTGAVYIDYTNQVKGLGLASSGMLIITTPDVQTIKPHVKTANKAMEATGRAE